LAKMDETGFQVVTGAFGFAGKYIAGLLLERGERVRTLTGHPDRPSPFGERVEVVPFDFDKPDALRDSLRGASVVYNTYWVRFNRGEVTFERAVARTRILIRAALEAGVERFVHISITNPSESSPFGYFRGKAEVERALAESGLSYAILRPAVLFGKEGVLINNIAWMVRRLPVFGVFGAGDYRMRPTYVGDLAQLAVEMGERRDNLTLDAVGPETFTFKELIRLIRERVGSRCLIIHVPPRMALAATTIIGWLMRDVVITAEEVGGLMSNLLAPEGPPSCATRLSEWLKEHGAEVGREYVSDLKRHF